VAVFSRQDLLGERQVYRTSGSLVAWWAWAAFAAALLVVLALGHHTHAALVTAVVVIAITGIMYACALRPRIVASDAGVTVVNPLREHVLPWSAVTQVDLKHNVRVHYRGPAGDTIVHSWAVQSSGRSRRRHALRARIQGSPAGPDIPPASPRVRWAWGPIAAIAVPLLLLVVVALA
jgi:hypothetical protein